MSGSMEELMGQVLLLKAQGKTKQLSKEEHGLFSSMGCDPHCHFCMEPLNVGDEFGFKRMRPGISGTACARCIKEDRPAPQVALDDAEERRLAGFAQIPMEATPQFPPKQRPGFLLFDEVTS